MRLLKWNTGYLVDVVYLTYLGFAEIEDDPLGNELERIYEKGRFKLKVDPRRYSWNIFLYRDDELIASDSIITRNSLLKFLKKNKVL